MEEYLHLFDNKEATVLDIWKNLLQSISQMGDFTIEVKKTNLHLVKETAFLGVHPKKKWLDLNIVSKEPIDHPLLTKVDQVSKNRYHNNVRLYQLSDVDKSLILLIKDAYDR